MAFEMILQLYGLCFRYASVLQIIFYLANFICTSEFNLFKLRHQTTTKVMNSHDMPELNLIVLRMIWAYQKELLMAMNNNLRIQFGFSSNPYTWDQIFNGVSILDIPIDVESFVSTVLDFYQKNPLK